MPQSVGESGMSEGEGGVGSDGFGEEIAGGAEIEGPQPGPALGIQSRSSFVGWDGRPGGEGSFRGNRRQAEIVAKTLACLLGKIKEIVAIAGECFFGERFTAGCVLHAEVEAKPGILRAGKQSVGAKYDDIGAGINAQALEGRFCQRVFIREREFALRTGDVLA